MRNRTVLWKIRGGFFPRNARAPAYISSCQAGYVLALVMLLSQCLAAVAGSYAPEFVFKNKNNGLFKLWHMAGTNKLADDLFTPNSDFYDAGWRIAGTSAVSTLDGKADLIFQYIGPTGDPNNQWLAVWFMNGATQTSSALLNPYYVDPAGISRAPEILTTTTRWTWSFDTTMGASGFGILTA